MNRFRLRSFCRADEKLYKKPILFLAKWQDPNKLSFPIMNMYMLNCTLKFQIFECVRLLLGAKSMPFGCMSMARLGAKYAEVGCKSMDTFGCMSMPFHTFRQSQIKVMVHVYGSVGCMYAVVGCMPDCRQLCLTVGSFA